MPNITTNWELFKVEVDTRSLPIFYCVTKMGIRMWAYAEPLIYIAELIYPKKYCKIKGFDCGLEDARWADWNTNYLSKANQVAAITSDGTKLNKTIAAKRGRALNRRHFSFTTADLDSLENKNSKGVEWSDAVLKLYDSEDIEITTEENEGNAIKTIVSFEPTVDYEILKGGMKVPDTLSGTPESIWRVDVVGVFKQLNKLLTNILN